MNKETYRIVRFKKAVFSPCSSFYSAGAVHRRVLKRGLTLEEAQAHCNDPRTHAPSRLPSGAFSPSTWFDGYEMEVNA